MKEMDLKGMAKKLFFRACNLIYLFQKSIEKEIIEKDIEKRKRNG